MLVVHRTGCGKTATMIQIADNYFRDLRPKVLVFPTNAVCASFYRELRNPHFPNRYADYLERGGFRDAKKALELSGILRNGVLVLDDFLQRPDLPAAPLRAFSYTMAGGASSCGKSPNAVFKCPDGYAGSYPDCLPRAGGYLDSNGKPKFDNKQCNPFSNKVILMDEVHNLVRPSPEILRDRNRTTMLQRLRKLLFTAENSVVIGLTGTPLCDVPTESAALLKLIKGHANLNANDEGFVSYYMDAPVSVFPSVMPQGVPRELPDSMLRIVPLRNLPLSDDERRGPMGNRHMYLAKEEETLKKKRKKRLKDLDSIDLMLLSRRCTVSQTSSYAGRTDVASLVHGMQGNLLRCKLGEAAYGKSEQARRARGYATKLHQIVEDVEHHWQDAKARPKTLVIIHRSAGYLLLLRMLERRFGNTVVRGFPRPKTQAERNSAPVALHGPAHTESPKHGTCPCALCVFNRAGCVDEPSLMVADAKECGEGVNFLGVRRLLLADVPTSPKDYVQRVGRAVRFLSHGKASEVPAKERERRVDVRLYVARAPDSATADEELVTRLRDQLQRYGQELQQIKDKAFDAGRWQKDPETQEAEEEGEEDEPELSESGDEDTTH